MKSTLTHEINGEYIRERACLIGIISDEIGNPIPKANVRLEQGGKEIAYTTTDDSGRYRLEIHPCAGSYDLSTASGNLGIWKLGMELVEGERRTLNLTLKEAVSIEGILLMLDDATPHVAVSVQAICDGKVIATVLSDDRGRYRFVNLKPGEYQVRCQVLGGYVYYYCPTTKVKGQTTEDEPSSLFVSRSMLKNIDFRFPPFKKGIWKTYNYLDGLAANWVRAIYCEPDGVIWFGTTAGLSRYDGNEFVNLTTKDGLAHRVVYAIHRDPDGLMWFGTDGGVSRYDGKEFVNLTTEDGLAHNSVWCIHQETNGFLWFGTLGGGVSRYDGKEFVNLTIKDGLAHNNVSCIHQDPNGVLWFGTQGGGVSRYDGKVFVNLTTEDGLPDNRISAIHRDPDGVMWFGTGIFTFGSGLCRYDGKEFVKFTTADGLACNAISSIYRGPDGVLWIGTDGGGVSRYISPHPCFSDEEAKVGLAEGGSKVGFANFTAKDGLADNRVRAIHSDRDGALWFATEGFGVTKYNPNEFVTFTTKDGLPDNRIRAVYREPNGVMWFGAGWWLDGSGLSRYDGKRFVNFTKDDGLADNRVCAIQCDRDGVMWFGTVSGAFRYDGREFVNIDKLAGNWINSIKCDPDGAIWFATGWNQGNGIFRYDGKELVNFTTKDGLAHNMVNAIYCDPGGVIWFATDGGISRYDGKEFINFTTEDGLVRNEIANVYRDTDGSLLLATEDGVSRYDGKRLFNFTKEDGLAQKSVFGPIYKDSDGIMWFSVGQGGGLSGYDGTAWTSLDARDGLTGNRIEAILQDPDGVLWFGTEGGVTCYRKNLTPPKARVVSVTTDQTYRDLSTIPAFTLGTRVTIEYSSTDFKTIPEKRQYRCRIKEIDSDWRKPTKDISADFIFQEPGTYTFAVQAIDRDLNYSEPASLKLEVIPDPRNHQIAQLKGELAERERAEMMRMQQELDEARKIQQSLLPEKPPEIEGFQIAGTSIPSREVGGDFYDYLLLGDNVGIVLADVSGKSVRAAMVGAMTDGILHSEIRERKEVWNSPKMILEQVNMGLHPRIIRGMYTAMSLIILRAGSNQLSYSNAGIPYPILKRGHEVRELVVNGIPVGFMDKMEYEDMDSDLNDGDFIILCSDGVIEATNEAGEMYESERLLELVSQADLDLSAQEMIDLILKDVNEFVDDEEASDDITVVVIRCKRL